MNLISIVSILWQIIASKVTIVASIIDTNDRVRLWYFLDVFEREPRPKTCPPLVRILPGLER